LELAARTRNAQRGRPSDEHVSSRTMSEHSAADLSNARLALRANNRIDAAKCLILARDAAGQDIDSLKEVAGLLVEASEFALAVEVFDTVLLLRPKDIEARLGLIEANSFIRLNALRQAKTVDFAGSLSRDPMFGANYFLRLSKAYERLSHRRDAIIWARKAMRKSDDAVAPALALLQYYHENRAFRHRDVSKVQYRKLGIPFLAEWVILRKMSKYPNILPNHLKRFMAFAERKEYRRLALRFARRCYGLEKTPEATVDLSRCLVAVGRVKQATVLMIDCMPRLAKPTPTDIVVKAAQVLALIGKPDLEMYLLDQARSERPNDTKIAEAVTTSKWLRR
jgi:hypothetical protein